MNLEVDLEALMREPRNVLVERLRAKQVYELRKSKEACENSLSQ